MSIAGLPEMTARICYFVIHIGSHSVLGSFTGSFLQSRDLDLEQRIDDFNYHSCDDQNQNRQNHSCGYDMD